MYKIIDHRYKGTVLPSGNDMVSGCYCEFCADSLSTKKRNYHISVYEIREELTFLSEHLKGHNYYICPKCAGSYEDAREKAKVYYEFKFLL